MRQADLFDPPPYRVTKLDLKGHDMKVDDAFPSKYLKSDDIGDRFEHAVIENCQMEELRDGERKPVLYFQNKKKGMVVNRINWDNLSLLYGEDSDDWIGKEILIYTERTSFQGKTTLGLRVRGPKHIVQPATRLAVNRARPIPADEPPDWEPDR